MATSSVYLALAFRLLCRLGRLARSFCALGSLQSSKWKGHDLVNANRRHDAGRRDGHGSPTWAATFCFCSVSVRKCCVSFSSACNPKTATSPAPQSDGMEESDEGRSIHTLSFSASWISSCRSRSHSAASSSFACTARKQQHHTRRMSKRRIMCVGNEGDVQSAASLPFSTEVAVCLAFAAASSANHEHQLSEFIFTGRPCLVSCSCRRSWLTASAYTHARTHPRTRLATQPTQWTQPASNHILTCSCSRWLRASCAPLRCPLEPLNAT